MRGKYWENTELANKLRVWLGGKPKPSCASWDGWDEWHKGSEKHVLSHIVVDIGLDWLQTVICWPREKFDNARYYCKNRWGDKLHYLRTGLKPGEYYELDTRLMHGMFEGLVDFIEVEKAWMHVVFDDEARKAYPALNRPWWLRWKGTRCPEAGIAYLEWEIGLGDESPQQAEAAYAQLVMYRWWKARPDRPDPWKESGLNVIYSMLDKKYGHGWNLSEKVKITDAEQAVYNEARAREEKLEAFYDQEDQEMMIKLIMIRRSLWT